MLLLKIISFPNQWITEQKGIKYFVHEEMPRCPILKYNHCFHVLNTQRTHCKLKYKKNICSLFPCSDSLCCDERAIFGAFMMHTWWEWMTFAFLLRVITFQRLASDLNEGREIQLMSTSKEDDPWMKNTFPMNLHLNHLMSMNYSWVENNQYKGPFIHYSIT